MVGMNTKIHWDRIWRSEKRGGPHDPFLDLFDKYFKGKILDIGAGKTRFQEWMRSEGRDYTSLDLSSECGADVVFEIKKDNPLPFDNEAFDTVIASHILEHLDYGTEKWCLQEAHRIMKSGGHLLIELPEGGVLGEHMVVLKDMNMVERWIPDVGFEMVHKEHINDQFYLALKK